MAGARRKFKDYSAVALLALYPTFILPLSTYFTAPSAYLVSSVLVALFFSAAAGLAALALAVVCNFVGEREKRVLFFVLFYISIVLYYNYNFHDYGGKIFGADEDIISNTVPYLDYVIYAVVVILIALLHRPIISNRDTIAVFFIISNLLILLTVLYGTLEKKTRGEATAVTQIISLTDFYQLSSKRNFIHILLDGFQGTVFQKVINGHPDIKAKLMGFVFYPDATSSSKVSYLSVPSVFSGKPYDGTKFISEYLSSVGFGDNKNQARIKSPPLISYLSANSYRTDILAAPGGAQFDSDAYAYYALTDFSNDLGKANGLARIVDVTLVKALPWALKSSIYRNGDWYFTQLFDNEKPRANRAIEFLKIFGDRMEPTTTRPVYKFIHLLTPHGPWTTDAHCDQAHARGTETALYQQSKCTLLALVALLDSLEAKGIYDNAAILVHGDHGAARNLDFKIPDGSVDFPKYVGKANPLILIKPLASRGPLRTSKKQVQLIDIPATVLDILGIDGALPAESMLSARRGGNIEREYFDFEPNRLLAMRSDRFTKVKKCVISGPIGSPSSWRLETSVDLDGLLKGLDDFELGVVIDISKSEVRQGDVMWIKWDGPAPRKNTYAYIDGDEVPVSIDQERKVLSFPLKRKRENISALYLVNPTARIRQPM